jgi:tetratricopeptide (TPR) repeat protein
MKRFAAVMSLLLAGALPLARAQQSSDDQYIAIYTLIQQADALQADGQPRQALADYTQALADLQKFQKLFPDWTPTIVSYRMGYLTDKVNSLTAQSPPLPQAGTPTNTPASAPPMPATAPEISTAPPVPVAPPTPATEAEMQLGVLRAQVQNLQAENDLLQAKLKEALSLQPAPADAREQAGSKAQILSLMKENDLLRASMKDGDTNGVAPAESSKEAQSLADANKKLAGQTRRAEKLALENQKLQSDATVSALEKAALEDRLKKKQAVAAVSDEVKTLRARLAVDEAQAVPYTPEELALMKSPAPAPAPAAVSAGQKKPISELPEGSAALVAEAQNYFTAGEFDKAEADYLRISQRDPGNALVLANLAAIELEEKKFDAAETNLAAALAKNPDDAYTLSTFGYLKFRQQKYDEALDALSRAATLDPANPQIQNYLGVTLSHKGLRAQAETALRKAIELAPNYGGAHNNLAVVYLGETPPSPALARFEYQKALELGESRNPELEKTLAGLGAPVSP